MKRACAPLMGLLLVFSQIATASTEDQTAAVPAPSAAPTRSFRPFRVDLAGFGFLGSYSGFGGGASFSWYPASAFGVRGTIGLAKRYRVPTSAADLLAVSTYTGSLDPVLGLEAEWNPLRIPLRQLEDWFALGLVGGISTLPTGQFGLDGLHAGLRVRANIVEWIGIALQGRAGAYVAADLGLVISI